MSENKNNGNNGNSGNSVLLEVEGLKTHFPINAGIIFQKTTGIVKAVDGVDFHINKGETLGLVGESGCGKTTVGRTILHLEQPTEGRIIFEGRDITHITEEERRPLSKRMQMIFQDPFGCLNPRMTAGEIIGEPMLIHNTTENKADYKEQVKELLHIVGLNPAMDNRYPHEFSGGQRQRIGIAKALSVRPSLIICDEPVSALDVSIQAQIINLLEDLQEQFNLTYLFIAHDLAVVRHISSRVAVMYLGDMVEVSNRLDIYRSPLHPYTRALLSAVPIPDPDVEATREHTMLKGEIPSPVNPPLGCKFHPRCPRAEFPRCSNEVPVLRSIDSTDHHVSCHFPG